MVIENKKWKMYKLGMKDNEQGLGRSNEDVFDFDPPERGSQRFSWRMIPWKSIATTLGLGLGAAILTYVGLDQFFHGTHDTILELNLAKAIVVPLAATLGVATGILVTHYVNPFKDELRRIENQ